MEQLTYKLEGFEGPLETLLYLISKNKLNIYDIPISELLDQYIAYLHAMQRMDLEITSDFLEMASRLVQIKAAMLLPKQEEQPDDDPRAGLMQDLIDYQTCRSMAALLRARQGGAERLTRPPEPLPKDVVYRLHHDPRELRRALMESLAKARRRRPPTPDALNGVVGRPVVSVASRAVHVLRSLIRFGAQPLSRLFLAVRARSEAVAVFLAVLELVRSQTIALVDEPEETMVKIRRGKRTLKSHGR